jgi:CheY-like chemotaxis protein
MGDYTLRSVDTDQSSVLVIDDDPAQAAVIMKMLQGGRYAFTICNDADNALLLLNGPQGFDLIFCASMLPGFSVLQMVEYLRRTKGGENTPIIMMGTHGGGSEVGDDAKPFTTFELRIAVDLVMATSAQPALIIVDRLI